MRSISGERADEEKSALHDRERAAEDKHPVHRIALIEQEQRADDEGDRGRGVFAKRLHDRRTAGLTLYLLVKEKYSRDEEQSGDHVQHRLDDDPAAKYHDQSYDDLDDGRRDKAIEKIHNAECDKSHAENGHQNTDERTSKSDEQHAERDGHKRRYDLFRLFHQTLLRAVLRYAWR